MRPHALAYLICEWQQKSLHYCSFVARLYVTCAQEYQNSVILRTQNWLSCAELKVMRRINKAAQKW